MTRKSTTPAASLTRVPAHNLLVLPEPAQLLTPVVEAVRLAGAMISAEWHRPGGPRRKAGYATKALIDDEAELVLRDRLMALHACAWRGEELGAEGFHDDVWAVDPQDGTRGFLAGLRGSAVSVALLRRGVPVLGVVFAPTAPDDAGDLFAWAEGTAPMRNGRPLPRLVPGSWAEGTIVLLNEDAGDYAAHNHAVLAPAAALAMPSIAYRLALAAAGEADVAISLTAGLEAYDVAGGLAILGAVGGEAVDLRGRPLDLAGFMQGCVGGRPGLVAEAVRRASSLPNRHAVPRHPARPAMRVAAAPLLARAQSCLLGQITGDALGAQVEFQAPSDIARSHPQGVRDMRAGGTWGLLAGQITDDTEMALSLARSLVAEGGFNEQAVGRAYLGWGASSPFDMGSTTRMGLAALAGRGSASPASQANGALMRVSPIGIAAAGDPARAAAWARVDAALTHPHPVCVAASGAFAAAIAAGVAGAEPQAMWAQAHAHAGEGAGAEEVRTVLREARAEGVGNATRQAGWVLIGLRNAMHRLWVGQPLEAALIETVSLGGDTDTNAAICGALLGASQGREAVPVRWRRAVLACRPCTGTPRPRPPALWADDALELAEALLATSTSSRRSTAERHRSFR